MRETSFLSTRWFDRGLSSSCHFQLPSVPLIAFATMSPRARIKFTLRDLTEKLNVLILIYTGIELLVLPTLIKERNI
jgi:hypothetical protein